MKADPHYTPALTGSMPTSSPHPFLTPSPLAPLLRSPPTVPIDRFRESRALYRKSPTFEKAKNYNKDEDRWAERLPGECIVVVCVVGVAVEGLWGRGWWA